MKTRMATLRTVWEYIDLIIIAIIIGYVFYSGLGGVLFQWATLSEKQWPDVVKSEEPKVQPVQTIQQPEKPLPRAEQPQPLRSQKESPIPEQPKQPPPEIITEQPKQPAPHPEQPKESIPPSAPAEPTEPIPPIEQPSGQPAKPVIDMPSLEKKVFDMINHERVRGGRKELKWNEDIAKVARLHSQYLAGFNKGLTSNFYLNHADAKGELQDSRLSNAGIYYFDMSAENLHVNSIVKRYWVDEHNTPAEYNNEDELAQKADTGWMTSPGHRQNLMTGEYDESGLGIATDVTGTNYIYTQVFIRRVSCGYQTGPCCEKTGYLPYCFIPLQCSNEVCG